MRKNISLRDLVNLDHTVTELSAAYEGMKKIYIEFFHDNEMVMKVDATLEDNGGLFHGWVERWDSGKVAYVDNLHPTLWAKIRKFIG